MTVKMSVCWRRCLRPKWGAAVPMGGPWVQAALLAAVFFLYGEIPACQLLPVHPGVHMPAPICSTALHGRRPVSGRRLICRPELRPHGVVRWGRAVRVGQPGAAARQQLAPPVGLWSVSAVRLHLQ